MISRSATVAGVAVLLSLAIHFLGVRFTWSLQQPPQEQPMLEQTSTEIVAPGSAFEDLAEDVSDPVTPEPTPAPEPVTVPTSDAQVASDTPQQVTTPDTGTSQTAPTDLAGPVTPQDTAPPQPTTIDPVGGDDGAVAEPTLVPPAGLDAATSVPQGQPSAPAEVVEAPAQTPTVRPSTVLPSVAAPVPPVAVIPVIPSAPVVPLQPSDIDPEPPVTIAEPEPPQTPTDPVDSAPSDLAVTTSLRPRLPAQRPSPAPEGLPDGASENTEARLAPSQLIESPLTAYRRDGANVFGQLGGGAQSGRQGFGAALGAGNSDATNYAGQVLVHLNRTAPVPVTGKGWARVFFLINPDGSLASVDVLDSSGSRPIERAAREQVRSAAPFPRPPGGDSRRLNFVYRIQ